MSIVVSRPHLNEARGALAPFPRLHYGTTVRSCSPPGMRAVALLLGVVVPLATIGAQEPSDTPTARFRVVEIRFDVDGPSRPDALAQVIELSEGDEFASVDDLNTAVADARQDLINRRVFDEIEVGWEIRVEGGDTGDVQAEPLPVVVTFVVDDGWTLLPIPFYRYNSNTGHNPFVVVYWDNILGTLTDFGLSAGYYVRDWPTTFAWDVRLDWGNVRMLDRAWSFGIDQEYWTEEQAAPDGRIEFAYTGYETRARISTSLRLTDWLRYSLAPGITANYGYSEVTNRIDEDLPPNRFAVGYSHRLSTGDTDWIGNLRRGWSLSLSNGISYDAENREWPVDFGLSGERHWVFGRFSPALRGRLTHEVLGDKLGLGGPVRGVANNRVFGQTALVANSQVSIRLTDWDRVTEVQLIPYIDAVVARKEREPVTWDDAAMGFGFDLVVFPYFIRGFEARASFGLDARDVSNGVFPRLEFGLTDGLEF